MTHARGAGGIAAAGCREATPVESGLAPVPFTRASGLHPFVRFLDDLGAPTDRLLTEVKLARSALHDGDALIPLLPAYRFAEKAARTQGIVDLGLQVGLRTSAFDLGSYGGLLRHCVSVYDYLQTGIRLIDTVTSGERFWFTPEEGGIRLHQSIPGEEHPGHAHADLFTLAVTLRTLRRFLGDRWTPAELRLHSVHDRIPPGLESLARGIVVTGRPHTSFVISKDVLEIPLPIPDDDADGSNSPGDRITPELPEDFLSSLYRLTESLLVAGSCRIEWAAAAAGTSVRTLQRRLAESGVTFRRIVGDTRVRTASRWLASTEKPVLEIALDLGYENPSNFTRAFRRRAGMSPQQYRSRCQGGKDAIDGIIAETEA